MMKIIKISVKKLNNRFDYNLFFNEDINIITGDNGTGKTTILKLIWFLISGNIERVFDEISFDSILLETSLFTINLETEIKKGTKYCSINIKIDGVNHDKKINISNIRESDFFIDDFNKLIVTISKSSLYFPTFRRIEGGYLVERNRRLVQEALERFASTLSVYEHKFITTISTNDLVHLLTLKYAEASDITNNLYIKFSKSIEGKIKTYNALINESNDIKLINATKIIDDINKEVHKNSLIRDSILKKFTTLSDLISKIFKYDGIKITNSLILGNSSKALNSDILSAGEKQMLSFLCYNAFFEQTIIFIDEPEISLHIDWQRLLLPTLIQQETNNQFFIATHSPFIYSKYPDKEVVLENKNE